MFQARAPVRTHNSVLTACGHAFTDQHFSRNFKPTELSLNDIHSLAYYFDNLEEMRNDLRNNDELADQLEGILWSPW